MSSRKVGKRQVTLSNVPEKQRLQECNILNIKNEKQKYNHYIKWLQFRIFKMV